MLMKSDTLSEEKKKRLENISVFALPSTFSFIDLDSYIRFMIITINSKISESPNVDMHYQLHKINRILSKLMLKNTKYDGVEPFSNYCIRLSKLWNTKYDRDVVKEKGSFKKLNECDPSVPFIFCVTEDVYRKIIRGNDFIEPDANMNIGDTLKEHVQGLSISVNRQPSTYLSDYDCHVEICVILRYLREIFIYLCNCTSWGLEEGLHSFDLIEISQRFEAVKICIKRIKNVCL